MKQTYDQIDAIEWQHAYCGDLGINDTGTMMGHTHTEFNSGQNAVTVLGNMSANDYIDFQQIYGTNIYMGPQVFMAST